MCKAQMYWVHLYDHIIKLSLSETVPGQSHAIIPFLHSEPTGTLSMCRSERRLS